MSFFAPHTKRTHIVIKIGSHSIKTAIFEKPTEGIIPIHIRKIVTKLNPLSKGNRVLGSLHELLASLLKEKEQVPEKIVIGIGPNIAETSLQEWGIDSLHLRESLTRAHIQKYFQQLFNEHRDANHSFLAYPVAIHINGYRADTHSLAAYAPLSIKEITVRTVMMKFFDEMGSVFGDIKKVFSGIPIEFTPLQAVAGEVLGTTCHINDAILLDVGGSLSTIMFMRQGSLIQLNSFPLGADQFSHRIIKTRGGKFVEAEDLSRQYGQGLMSKDEQTTLSHIFSEERIKWKEAFARSLEAYYPIAPLPQELYLYGGGSYIPEVRSALWGNEVVKNFSSFQSFNVHMVQAPQIFNNDGLEGVIRGPEDVGLACLMYYSLFHAPLF